MNAWMLAASILLLAFIPCGIVLIRAPVMDRLVSLEMSGILSILILVLLSISFREPSFLDLALTLAVLSFSGSLVFIYFLEHGL